MTSLKPDIKELEEVQKRLSETMRDIDKEDEETIRLTNAIEGASSNDLYLMTRTASSSRRRRNKADVKDMNSTVEALRQKLFESERRKARLWEKMADLKGQAEEIKGRLN
uniref:Uncharacterized protein n=1 Tax=Photinus pyralis TaxID=7054 RepID=A0A1Y1KHU5_PHOPY